MIAVTGAAGFIGSRVIKHLNDAGITDIIAIDDLTDGHKFKNLKGLDFAHYIDKDDFLAFLSRNSYYVDIEAAEGIFAEFLVSDIDTIIHLGAISETTCWDGKKVMAENYEYSVKILDHLCSLSIDPKARPKFIYASSASVYGNNEDGTPDPLNMYAFSKYMFDKYVIRKFEEHAEQEDGSILPQIVGLRFFNVYGSMNEWHKGGQASPVFKFFRDISNGAKVKLFDVRAQRDFVHVDDVCSVIMHFMQNEASGIFDVGTGNPRSFDDVFNIVARRYWRGMGGLRADMYTPPMPSDIKARSEKIPFPAALKGHYQYHTRANLDSLRSAGYDKRFLSLEEGIDKFIEEAFKAKA